MEYDNPWKTISSEIVYESSWMSLRHDRVITPSGKPGSYDVVLRRNFVVAIPKNEAGNFILVNQARYTVAQNSWEFPMGGIETGEENRTAANRELEEETGYKSNRLTKIGQLWVAVGHTPCTFATYLAEDLEKGTQKLDDTEWGMKVKIFTLEEVKNMVKDGTIKDSPSIASLGLYLINK